MIGNYNIQLTNIGYLFNQDISLNLKISYLEWLDFLNSVRLNIFGGTENDSWLHGRRHNFVQPLCQEHRHALGSHVLQNKATELSKGNCQAQ
ncbi:hypothetical protein FGO68_gene7886 [Halteria grandinella]|uniref:Uncharacterized protein n=1 Tax=Halteria grandinella TaxID=5974 RepID=A0A8J8P8N9_HALGN|nr:hypothetical protein FGO68_gene7886 [Halteria grandinella]